MNQTHNTNFYEMLAAACRKNGKGTAVFNDKEKTTYHALKQEVDAVAAYLQNMGVKFGDKVALAVSIRRSLSAPILPSPPSARLPYR